MSKYGIHTMPDKPVLAMSLSKHITESEVRRMFAVIDQMARFFENDMPVHPGALLDSSDDQTIGAEVIALYEAVEYNKR